MRNLVITGGIGHDFADAAPALAGLLRDAAIESTITQDIEGGGGLLALHTAVICFDDWAGWKALLGGQWRWGRVVARRSNVPRLRCAGNDEGDRRCPASCHRDALPVIGHRCCAQRSCTTATRQRLRRFRFRLGEFSADSVARRNSFRSTIDVRITA